MFSRATAMIRSSSDRFLRRRPFNLPQEKENLPCHIQTSDEHECLRNVAIELNNVAVDLYAAGDYTTAIDLYRDAAHATMMTARSKENDTMCVDDETRANFIAQIVRGKQQLYQAMSSQSSGDSLDSYQWSESEADDCVKCLSEAMKIDNDQAHNSDYVNVATVMYNTAILHMKNDEIDIAEKCFDLAMESYKVAREEARVTSMNNCAFETLVFADLFNNVGYLQCRNGDVTNAKSSFANALKIGKNALEQVSGDYKESMIQGYKHIGTIYYNIGIVNAMLGLKEKVIRPLECSVGLQKVALGESHPDIAIVQHNIGTVLVGIGKFDEAISAFLKSLQMVRFAFGNDDCRAAKELFHIGKVHEMRGEYAEAIHVYQETLRIERLTLGVDNAETVMTMYEIGQVHQNKGDINEALDMYHDILSIAKASSDIDESSLLFILRQMITIHLDAGNIEAATKLYTEVASTIELNSGDNTIVDIVGFAQIKDLLTNPPAAAAA
jgi:tetratricopeptide (TPR) repeat protein